MTSVKRSWPDGYFALMVAGGGALCDVPIPIDEFIAHCLLLSLILLAFVHLCPSPIVADGLRTAFLAVSGTYAVLAVATKVSRRCRVLVWRGVFLGIDYPVIRLRGAFHNVTKALMTLLAKPTRSEVDSESLGQDDKKNDLTPTTFSVTTYENEEKHTIIAIDGAEHVADLDAIVQPYHGQTCVQGVEISFSNLSKKVMKWKSYTDMMGKHDFDPRAWSASLTKLPNLTDIILKNVHIDSSKVGLSMFPKMIRRIHLDNCMIFEKSQEKISTVLWNKSIWYRFFALRRFRAELIEPAIQSPGKAWTMEEVLLKDCFDQNLNSYPTMVAIRLGGHLQWSEEGTKVMADVAEWGRFRKRGEGVAVNVKAGKDVDKSINVLKIVKTSDHRVSLSFIDSSEAENADAEVKSTEATA